ncbi:MAG: LysR family transcriptional regulator [Bradymonadia bacterium]
MSMPRHNIDQLLVLDAIVRTGSFAAAAESLNRVPSAVTYAVRNLEESLGIPLFEKVGRRSLLTADGHLLLEQARSVLAQARGLDRLADELAGEWETSIRLVADAALPITQIVRGLKRFFDRGLPTRVRLDIECQDGVLERFETEHADIMLTLDFDRESGTFTLFPLPVLEMVLVASAGHGLAHKQKIEKDDLAKELELVVKDTAKRFRDKPRASFIGTDNVIFLPDFHAKRLALLSGIGFGWTPKHIVADDLDSGALVLLDLVGGHHWTYHPRLVHRSTEPLGPAGMKLIEDLTVAFTETI